MADADKPKLLEFDISAEEWREYEWLAPIDGVIYTRAVRIERPTKLYLRPGGSTHRVVDGKGIAYCVPTVGAYGCVLTWKSLKGKPPVQF